MNRIATARALAYLKRYALPAIGARNQRIIEMTQATGGHSCNVWRVVLEDRVVYVKGTPTPARWTGVYSDLQVLYPQHRLVYEAAAIHIAARVLAAGTVPEIYHASANGRWLLLSDVAATDGQLLDSEFLALSDLRVVKRLASIAAGLANDTHEIPHLRGERLDVRVREVKLNHGLVRPLLAAWPNDRAVHLAAFGAANESVAIADCLCHGDFHPRNVIVGSNGRVAIIDFEESIVHDCMWDIATMCAHYALRAIHHRSSGIATLCTVLIEAFMHDVRYVPGAESAERRLFSYMAGWIAMRTNSLHRSRWLSGQSARRARELARALLLRCATRRDFQSLLVDCI